MPDYFGYIHEASYDDIDDVDVVYNEMDSSLAEFDSYVQEGVGLNVIIGIGYCSYRKIFLKQEFFFSYKCSKVCKECCYSC